MSRPPGAPEGNRNAETYGACARGGRDDPAPTGEEGGGLEGQIRDLDRRIVVLQAYIDEHMLEWGLDEINTAHRLLSELNGRVTRMRQARDRMEGSEDDELVAAVNEALDSLAAEWGVEL